MNINEFISMYTNAEAKTNKKTEKTEKIVHSSPRVNGETFDTKQQSAYVAKTNKTSFSDTEAIKRRALQDKSQITSVGKIQLLTSHSLMSKHRAILEEVVLKDKNGKNIKTKCNIKRIQLLNPLIYETNVYNEHGHKILTLETEYAFKYYSAAVKSGGNHLGTKITYISKNIKADNIQIEVVDLDK